ncbi:MAG: hypothetical protein A3E36_03915 [Candidatus Andersenbacteria bacterium RIFCSPHIGHO2_12_FULL_45_11b]|uniref:YgjP-like metallopeptidase domain-containing protein n=1 Tax=Candidatus Andersenbacteria bacterium RIFCSPHIGHO2_12_FULL_45_11b TaxID=1797282 RepID=A0A1G1X9L0_9BACT|nr:MAG: hypothetical protein A3E36_03915 [Candidatus Andersenbacteria bacterium RIFCSPHIGHO2_12_FULL_45_11b]
MKVQSALFPFPVSVRKSARARRMAIHVEASGGVELVLPKRASEKAGMEFLHERKDWIIQILRKQEVDGRAMKAFAVKDWEYLPCFGDNLQLRIHIEPNRVRSFVEEKQGALVVRIPDEAKLYSAVSRFYVAQAKHYFTGQTHEFAVLVQKSVKKVRVIDMKTQWGSCNHRTHALTFNWRLALAPEHIARYVVAHEVAHIIHANHSIRFWKTVALLDPAYATSRAWLKRYGGSLFLK